MGGARAKAVAGGAAADPVEHFLPRRHELLGCDVRGQGECLRHLGLHLRDLVVDEGIEGQRPDHDPDDLRVTGPQAVPPSLRRPARRTGTSPQRIAPSDWAPRAMRMSITVTKTMHESTART